MNGDMESKPIIEPEIECPCCHNIIDPEVCWCGDLIKHHYPPDCGHNPVPMGCDCGRIKE